MRSDRRLVTIRRTVPLNRRPEYDKTWEDLRAAVTATGAHAWRFVSSTGEFIEFIEFAMDGDPRSTTAVARRLAALASISPSSTEEWMDATLPEHPTRP